MGIRSATELALAFNKMRRKLNLTQLDVANRVGLKQKTISAFENNPESTKLKTVFLILSALQLELEVRERNKKTTSRKFEW